MGEGVGTEDAGSFVAIEGGAETVLEVLIGSCFSFISYTL